MNCIHCRQPLYEDRCTNQACLLHSLEQTEDDIPQLQDYRRQKIVERAVEMTDRVIMENSNGSVEETNYITSAVALRLVQKAHGPFFSQLLKKDLEDRHPVARSGA